MCIILSHPKKNVNIERDVVTSLLLEFFCIAKRLFQRITDKKKAFQKKQKYEKMIRNFVFFCSILNLFLLKMQLIFRFFINIIVEF